MLNHFDVKKYLRCLTLGLFYLMFYLLEMQSLVFTGG